MLFRAHSSEHGRVQPRLDLHRHQLLQEQFASVRDLDLADVLCGVASAAVVPELEKIGLAEEAAPVADVDPVTVRHVEQALFQEASGAVGDHAVALHLTETEATIASSTLGRLAGQDLRRAASP